ncbi:retrotransposon protein, putative, ty3-gypsy subclass [Tanacetum coccineum]
MHWVINPETGTHDVESIRQRRPKNITPADWDAQLAFWNDPRNQARAAQNRQNREKSTVVCRQGSRSLACLRDQMMESSATREYPSLIDTFFVTHIVGGVFTRDEDRAIYVKEMLRLHGLGSNTPSGVPYTREEINAMAQKGKQRGHLPGVGRVLSGRATDVLSPPPPQCTHNPTESSPEFCNASGSGGCGDDEMADDEDGEEDEEDEGPGDDEDIDVEDEEDEIVRDVYIWVLAPCRWGNVAREKYRHWRAFPFKIIRAYMSPGLGISISQRQVAGENGGGFVAGDSGKCCSVVFLGV